jgi:hypothetical protein
MKERPILFSATMVRAILEGRKSMTRRVCKPQPRSVGDMVSTNSHCALMIRRHNDEAWNEIPCRYGIPGDRLWVRETFRHAFKGKIPEACNYLADAGTMRWPQVKSAQDAKESWPIGWKPSIHMPRWASRILLEITNVRVERLQEITPADCIAEGLGYPRDDRYAALDNFKPLWESINGPGSWDTNPWVWVVGFKKLKP